ncbi:hypothetical protein Bccel_1630 [Pseudobacteroides cellulosolvens ATCC 35603 = DSM 2933]|uniref:Uncharacterized protein n=1 Tax=Pseudobacteroides cellulosolvens ATCC 35603 = DSM 2933 TaxID=398512 RepID=A0A0L6JKX7_9FIRM|nr:hypothetical protein [Pseudobacteroides cellulosolvens]KNY26368.1 hypothetical protein Bccel_1630 [Pseudobacteroides cellulosolvens ATCC 35603 = DSM 2933]
MVIYFFATTQQTSFIARLIEKTSLFPSSLLLLLGLVYGGIVSFITLFGKKAGIKNVGWFFLFFALGPFLVRTVSGKLFAFLIAFLIVYCIYLVRVKTPEQV